MDCPPVPIRAVIFVPWIQLLSSAAEAAVLREGFHPSGSWIMASKWWAGRISGQEEHQAHSVPVLSFACKCYFLTVFL